MTEYVNKGIKGRHYRCQQLAEKGGPSIYSGFTFAVNDSTKKQIDRYTKFRERQKAAEKWFDI